MLKRLPVRSIFPERATMKDFELLPQIESPRDLRRLSDQQLLQLADEIREGGFAIWFRSVQRISPAIWAWWNCVWHCIWSSIFPRID